MADDRAREAMVSGPERIVPSPTELVDALLSMNDAIKKRGYNQASCWTAMRELHETFRRLYAPVEMPDLKAVISELECIDSRLIELVEKAS